MEYHRRGTEIREIQILYSGKAHRRSVLEGARSRPGPKPHRAETPGRLAGINTEGSWSYCRLRLCCRAILIPYSKSILASLKRKKIHTVSMSKKEAEARKHAGEQGKKEAEARKVFLCSS